jgi:hypothetical protein
MKPPRLKDAVALFSKYRTQNRHVPDPLGNWIAEAEGKLEQLDWILRRVAVVEKRDDKLWRGRAQAKPIRPIGKKWLADRARRTEIQLLTEAFYYSAFRFRQIARKELGWKKFDAQGVRIVRNDLLEHPHETDSNPNFAYGVPEGPRIKLFGPPSRGFIDPGLYVNAKEFIDALLSKLRSVTT